MYIREKALLYDIANIAYTIADNHNPDDIAIHRVRDICQEGNIDRVARILGLAYSRILSVLLPVIEPPRLDVCHDRSATTRDYQICFRKDTGIKKFLPKERQLLIKETCHEYMVCMALADRLGITLPKEAEHWKEKALECLEVLKETVSDILVSRSCTFRRNIPKI